MLPGERSPWLAASIAAVVLGGLLAALAIFAVRAADQRRSIAEWREHTHVVLHQTAALNWRLTDMQRAQRGFLLTGQDSMLDPFRQQARAVQGMIARLRTLTMDNPVQQARLARLDQAVRNLQSELGETVVLAQDGRRNDAVAIVAAGLGEKAMNDVRAEIASIYAEEQRLLDRRNVEWGDAADRSDRFNTMIAIAAIVTGFATLVLVRMGGRAAAAGRRATIAAEALAISRRDLETAVAERTGELAAANAALTAEIARAGAAEAEVRQLQKLESIGQLTGGIAHDFNNMLAIVLGSLDLARRRLGDTADRRILGHIDAAIEGGRRAAELTQRLLAFARRQPLAPQPLDANKFVGGISQMLRRTLGEGVNLETVLAGGLWRSYADPSQLEQAIVNLAVNARDAMKDGGKLTIETANTHLDDGYATLNPGAEPGQYVVICVTDTGEGMSQDVADRAFDPFFTTKDVGKGTGLGLSQVFGFVKQSGGQVKIYSEIGQGTTVKLYLPRWHGADATGVSTAPPQNLPRGRDGETILVADDEAQVRMLSVDMLRELGYAVIEASDGEAALALLAKTERVDLLFTDIVMPGMNGRVLADNAVAARPGLKRLFTTGYTSNAVVHNGTLDPGVAFLPKPFTMIQLAAKVRQVLDGGGFNRAV